MTHEECRALYTADEAAWNEEADKAGNSWMRTQIFVDAINACLTSPTGSQQERPASQSSDSVRLASDKP